MYDDYLTNDPSSSSNGGIDNSGDNLSLSSSMKKIKTNLSYLHSISRKNTNVSKKSCKSQKSPTSPKNNNH